MKLPVYVIAFVFVAVAIFWLWYLFFNIFEVRFSCFPLQGEISPGQKIKFEAEPVNALGKKAIWRKVNFDAEIITGKELIEKREEAEGNGIVFVAGDNKGIVKIRVNSEYAYSPTIYEFEIK